VRPTVGAGPRTLVRGQIREKGTRDPIAGADVLITRGHAAGGDGSRSESAGSTREDGRFEVHGDGPQDLRIIVTDGVHAPCIRDVTTTELAGGQPMLWTCYTGPLDGPVRETVVNSDDRPELPKEVLTWVESRTVPGTMGDPLRAVQNLPGVARSPFGIGQLIIRGASPDDSGVFVDGLQVPSLYHFLVGPSVLTPGLINEIDFYPGGFGVRYGRMSGGMLDVSTHSEPPRQMHGSVEVSPLDASASLNTPLGRNTSMVAAVRRSTIDLVLPKLIPEKPGSTFTTAVPSYYDYQARIDHRTTGGRLSFFAFGSYDMLKVVSADPDQRLELHNHTMFHRAQVSWVTGFGAWTSRLAPAYGFTDQTSESGPDAGGTRSHRMFLREDLSRPLVSGLTLNIGTDSSVGVDSTDVNYIPLARRALGPSAASEVPQRRHYTEVSSGLYAEAVWDLTGSLRLTPGLRFDYYRFEKTDRRSLDPRLALHWALGARTSLNAGAGVFHQLPALRYFDDRFGNPLLRLIWAEQYHVGLERRLTELVRASATAFLVRRQDVPVADQETHFSSAGSSRAYGLELLLRHDLGPHFYGWVSYTLSRAQQTGETASDLASGLPREPGAPQDQAAQGVYRSSPYDQTHNLIVVGSYHRGAWEAGARYRFVSGTPMTPIQGGFFDSDFGGYTPQRGLSYSQRRRPFNQLDLRIERSFTFDAWRLGIYLDVQNVLNSENPEATLYDYRYQQSDPLRGLPILPFLGLRGQF
jgi:outer membrane receptor protein involved in Fe transport